MELVLQGPVPGPVWDRTKDRDRPYQDRTRTAKILVLSLVLVPVLLLVGGQKGLQRTGLDQSLYGPRNWVGTSQMDPN